MLTNGLVFSRDAPFTVFPLPFHGSIRLSCSSLNSAERCSRPALLRRRHLTTSSTTTTRNTSAAARRTSVWVTLVWSWYLRQTGLQARERPLPRRCCVALRNDKAKFSRIVRDPENTEKKSGKRGNDDFGSKSVQFHKTSYLSSVNISHVKNWMRQQNSTHRAKPIPNSRPSQEDLHCVVPD
jgi:hypothetical protein